MIYKLCDNSVYTNKRVRLDKEAEMPLSAWWQHYSSVWNLACKVEAVKHKTTMDNLCPHPDFLTTQKPRRYIHVRHCNPTARTCSSTTNWKNWNWKWMTYKLWCLGGLTAIVRKDQRQVYMLTNTDQQQAYGNFCNEMKNSLKPLIAEH